MSDLGRSYVNKIALSDNLKAISLALNQTEEFRQILLFEPHFPSQDYIDLTSELNRITTEGTYLEPDALLDFKLSLNTIISIRCDCSLRMPRFPVMVEVIF